jgi:hypothetical protein
MHLHVRPGSMIAPQLSQICCLTILRTCSRWASLDKSDSICWIASAIAGRFRYLEMTEFPRSCPMASPVLTSQTSASPISGTRPTAVVRSTRKMSAVFPFRVVYLPAVSINIDLCPFFGLRSSPVWGSSVRSAAIRVSASISASSICSS